MNVLQKCYNKINNILSCYIWTEMPIDRNFLVLYEERMMPGYGLDMAAACSLMDCGM